MGRGPPGRFFAMRLPELGRGLHLERALAGEDLVKHEAERVDVARRRHLASLDLLGGHVGGRSRPHVFSFDTAAPGGQAKVGEAHLAPAVDDDVVGLEVAVQDALGVGGGQPGANLAGHFDGAFPGHPPGPAQEGGEGVAVDILHREEGRSVNLAKVVHAADVGMRDLARDPHFTIEPREAIGIVLERLGQELERHLDAKQQIVGAEHTAHAALADQTADAITRRDDCARRQVAFYRRSGAGGGSGCRTTRLLRPRGRTGGVLFDLVALHVHSLSVGRSPRPHLHTDLPRRSLASTILRASWLNG